MKKSLLVTHIANVDYPLWRAWLHKYNSFFDEIIICWNMAFRYPFFNAFIQQDLSVIPHIKFLDTVEYDPATQDWRDVSTNEMLKHATGDWIISIEQDWFCKDWPKFFEWVTQYMELADLFGWMNPTNAPYIHPACFFIKRDLLERTSKDFSPHPEINGGDHFCQITYDAKRLDARIRNLPLIMDFSPDSFAFHLGGVNQNVLNGLTEGFEFHRPEAFMVYNFESRQLDIPQDPRFLGLSQDIETKLLGQFDIDIRNNQWTKFFKI